MLPEQLPDSASASPTAATKTVTQRGILEQLLAQAVAVGTSDADSSKPTGTLSGTSVRSILLRLLGEVPQTVDELRQAKRQISGLIARIDQAIGRQLNLILHHPRYQELESAWRGLHYLWKTCRSLSESRGDEGSAIQLRILNVSKSALQKDFQKEIDFDDSELFRKVYEAEFGRAGGTPYGLLIGNYEFTNHPDDIDLLKKISGVAAASFAPFIAAASPALLGLSDFSEIERSAELDQTFLNDRYIRWRALRSELDSRFLGLTLPRILLRLPYSDRRPGAGRDIRFSEDVTAPDRSGFLWGSAAWAFAAVVCRAFATSNWFADIRGVVRGLDSGGLVTGLPSCPFQTDLEGAVDRSAVEVQVSEERESELCDLGFIPLLHCKDTPFSAFYSNGSLNQPERYAKDKIATSNARLSSMLQYVLCCSRIAHYMKVKVRNLVGTFASARSMESKLEEWVRYYITPDDRADAEMKARFPLRDARVEITEIPGRPGEFNMTMHLQPHYQLDQLSSCISFVARQIT